MRTAIALLTMLTMTFVAGETASAQKAGESNASENAELAKKLSNRHAAVGIDGELGGERFRSRNVPHPAAAQDMRIGWDQMNTTR